MKDYKSLLHQTMYTIRNNTTAMGVILRKIKLGHDINASEALLFSDAIHCLEKFADNCADNLKNAT